MATIRPHALCWGKREVGIKRSDARGAGPSVVGRRDRWRKNTATAAAESTDAFQGEHRHISWSTDRLDRDHAN